MKYPAFTLARAADENREHVFYPSFWKMFAVTGGSVYVLLTLALLGLWSEPPTWEAFLAAQPLLLFAVVLEFFLTIWIVRAMRVRVGEKGVASTDYWCLTHEMSWAEMDSAKPVSVFGFPYLKVTSFKTRRALYVPRFCASQAALRAAIVATASPINPLRRSVENGDGEAGRERLRA